jgi:hypothetical protein
MLGTVRVRARPGESPEDDRARRELDQRVGPEPDERDRPGDRACRDRDRRLDCMPGEAEPGEQSRPTNESGAVGLAPTRPIEVERRALDGTSVVSLGGLGSWERRRNLRAQRRAEDVRHRRLEARGGEHDPVARVDLEAGPLDRRLGVAGRMTAAGDARPDAALV